jgi:holo-[acyl-carrier protein] synthase
MMTPNIEGLGNDILEIARIRESIERHGAHFLSKLFTPKEQEYCHRFKDPAPHFAGRFAAKEAIAKALGTGFGAELSWLEIEILNDDHGKPVVSLSQALNQRLGPHQLLVSISHSTEYATAVAILVTPPQKEKK